MEKTFTVEEVLSIVGDIKDRMKIQGAGTSIESYNEALDNMALVIESGLYAARAVALLGSLKRMIGGN